ncbi:MAG TPA: efflux RND transporter periplasmic adaptor subunit [Xanthobacteraceae bacterium]|nr:efflux RND transporter periplasmic adaptor subunit [Xanthobacteraceae bacterium]
MKLVENAERPGRKSAGRSIFWFCVIAAIVTGGGYYWYVRPAPQTAAKQAPIVPVTIAEAQSSSVPIFLDGLGTVSASFTVAIHSQVTGTVQSVNFTEGQEVREGDTLAIIDPRPLQAALTQAVAKKAQDQANLISAQKDLARYSELIKRDFATQQSLDQQQAKVDALKATIESDQGAIENAQTQLSYATITAPFDGTVGFRLVDAGNIIHPGDTQPLTVLTKIKPAMAIFTLPQKYLGDVREAMLRGTVAVLAYDQDGVKELANGELLLIDNQIDQATSTIRLKARFPNDDSRLWPGEFVRIRAKVDAKHDVVTVPPPALQRGPNGLYVWVIKPDNTADQRKVDVMTPDSSTVIVTNGLNPGEKVVVSGAYRLQVGTRVDAKPAPTKAAAAGDRS